MKFQSGSADIFRHESWSGLQYGMELIAEQQTNDQGAVELVEAFWKPSSKLKTIFNILYAIRHFNQNNLPY